MYGKPFTDGPAYVASTAADLYVASANTVARVTLIHLVNTSGSARTVSIYVGATGGSAGGTELLGTYSIAANDYAQVWLNGLALTSSQFITGVASAASAVTCTIHGWTEAA